MCGSGVGRDTRILLLLLRGFENGASGRVRIVPPKYMSEAGVFSRKKSGSRRYGPSGWIRIFTEYVSGAGVSSRNKNLSGAGVSPREKKKLSLERTTCLADKTNHPVERLSLNRSQCGSCSTKYDTSAGT